MIIHQIFGLLGDDMPDLFKTLIPKITDFSTRNNYKYIFWNKVMCDELVKFHYPQYEELYNNVKYPIMKVDIVRFLILHRYGGIYIDMDCIPVIKKLKVSDFVVAYKKGLKREHYEMEILQSKKNNYLLLEFLNYVKEQIIEKDKIEIYKTWKARYVYHTTGPYSLTRFLKKNKINPDKYIINEPDLKTKSLNILGGEEFISYPSCSYLVASSSYSKMKEIN